MGKEFEKLLESLTQQFLCCYPLHCINWDEVIPEEITWEQQRLLIDGSVQHPLNQKQPIKLSYQLNFLKRLLTQLERTQDEVHDIVYESLCAVQQCVCHDATEKYAYKHYLQPRIGVTLTLRESKSFVAEGTTGLCSWQASIALADYLTQHKDVASGKCVLELGAGTGLCGMVLMQCCNPRQLLLTDGSRECVELMKENVRRNFPEAKESKDDSEYDINGNLLKLKVLDWGAIEEFEWPHSFLPDLILAADVVYDDTAFEYLVYAIDNVFKKKYNKCEMLIAATVRNEYTLQKFLNLISQRNFYYVERDLLPINKCNFYWVRTTPVKLFHITRDS